MLRAIREGRTPLTSSASPSKRLAPLAGPTPLLALDLRAHSKVYGGGMNSRTISQLARRSGVPASTLRFYEKVGVIPLASRSGSGYRLYDERSMARLAFVQRARRSASSSMTSRTWSACGTAPSAPVQERLRSMVHEQRRRDARATRRADAACQRPRHRPRLDRRCRMRSGLRLCAAHSSGWLRAGDGTGTHYRGGLPSTAFDHDRP